VAAKREGLGFPLGNALLAVCGNSFNNQEKPTSGAEAPTKTERLCRYDWTGCGKNLIVSGSGKGTSLLVPHLSKL